MLPDFHEHPGLLFVAATLLPLLSFLLIFLACGAWAVLRNYHDSEGGESLFNLFGGEAGGRGAAYVATAAIAGAFLLSATGFVLLLSEEGAHEQAVEAKKEEVKELEKKKNEAGTEEKEAAGKELDEKKEELEQLERQNEAELAAHWKGRWDWLRVSPAGLNDPNQGTVLQLGYNIDTLSAVMFVMVTFIATLIHLFSIGYMGDELGAHVADHQVHTADGHLHRRGRFGRFFMFLSLFCFSMLNLVLADNLFQVFISWELVGICSYLLVGFYFERQSASNAANKAFITNRVGDAGFIIGLLILWSFVGSFNFEDIFARIRAPQADAHNEHYKLAGTFVRLEPVDEVKDGRQQYQWTPNGSGSHVALFPLNADHLHGIGNQEEQVREISVPVTGAKEKGYGVIPYWMLVIAGLGIFLGCVGKSAQFPLHVWLPDAMEGPTPVSALIHAATMVAAGVYLVGRAFPLFTHEARMTIAYTGGVTLFVAATVAIVMTDIKKVLAYSTVSQLGYMMLALGVGGWVAGLFHLLTHAFFKALLFLGSGSVIYGCHHEQDMLKMGGLRTKMRVTCLTMLSGVLAIGGIPFFTGWYSKDAILAQALGFAAVYPKHLLLFLLPLVTAGITAFYMFRMWFLTFTGKPRDEHVYEHAHESPWTMTVPLIILAVCSIAVAWGWPVWDAQASWLEHRIHHAQPSAVLADFGNVLEESEPAVAVERNLNVRQRAHELHQLAGNLAMLMGALGIVFATLLYYTRALDPGDAEAEFAGVHRFLWHKWYFDELYSVALVRPALVVANWFKAFDLRVIDGVLHGIAGGTLRLKTWVGKFDFGVIDGLANLIGDTFYDVGAWLRNVQTGYLRSYILFLVLAAVGFFMLLTYFVTRVVAG
jgi:NADH-quinone oxidoreductase subunit L